MNALLCLLCCVMSLAPVFSLIIGTSLYDFMIVFELFVIMRYVQPWPLIW